MIAYLDASALVKKYAQEVGSDRVGEIWASGDALAISAVGYAEIVAALGRRWRSRDLTASGFRRTMRAFHRDWQQLDVVGVSPTLHELIDGLVTRHPLQGFDALHLASALCVREEADEDVLFVSGDSRLLDAARGEGLATCPERAW